MAKILLAEDDESLRRFLAAALERAGHVVTSFGDGAEIDGRVRNVGRVVRLVVGAGTEGSLCESPQSPGLASTF